VCDITPEWVRWHSLCHKRNNIVARAAFYRESPLELWSGSDTGTTTIRRRRRRRPHRCRRRSRRRSCRRCGQQKRTTTTTTMSLLRRPVPVRVSSSSVNFSCAGAASLRECGVVARTDKLTGNGTSRCSSSVDACMTGVYTSRCRHRRSFCSGGVRVSDETGTERRLS